MINFNKAILRDKIHACWIGKNIGGTMGTPYEGRQQINDIQGFSTPEGVVLPNDDLDLQLVWLRAVEDVGPYALNCSILGEYWLNYIPPQWNEYGIGKNNMRAGLLPPMSGEYHNDWKHSNGAWIRTEVWACMAPGCPDVAIRYAREDACVDHGAGEGTFAAIFVAAVEAAAFVITDIRRLIDIGLSKIPEGCRMTRSMKLLLDCYDKGDDWKTARNKLVEDSADLGWFEAPANVAFSMLGMLYGEGDFKKSMILAINCGDDTDCTGATLGALWGIMYGTAGIPEDWKAHIGEGITTVAINRGSLYGVPETCEKLTDRVIAQQGVMMRANHVYNVQINDNA
ncbi:MAG: ADP-ribosylglycohydrolase family protein, partial [Clostridia bacterium]|nr:ADP-ribosylglycohydrolase family protein [Clostridia bacterium]